MKNIKLNWFDIVSLNWMFISLLAIFFAISGTFYLSSVLFSIGAGLGLTFLLIRKKYIQITALEKTDKLILGLIIAVGIILSYYTVPTVFEGRDEGTYALSAQLIAENHNLKHKDTLSESFSKIYGPGKALNFPGFYYDHSGAIKSQFLAGYSSWIAIFFSLGGIDAIRWVNLLPLITFVFSLYLLGKKFSSRTTPVIGAALILLTTFPVVLFYKFTLSEIYFGALAWFALYFLFQYFQDKNYLRFCLLILPFSLMLFSRVEALALVFMLFFILLIKDFTHLRQSKFQMIFWLIGLVFAFALWSNPGFFIDSFKNILPINSQGLLKTVGPEKSLLPDDWQNGYLFKVFYTYNLVPLLLVGIFIIGLLLKEKKYQQLIPLVFFAPTFIYLLDANISLDHPWMLRRFVFSIIPLAILYFVIFLDRLENRFKSFCWIMLFLVLLVNIFLSFKFIIFGQNQGLLEKTTPLASYFNQDDLVLVSQKSSGNGWSLISAPLRNQFKKQAVYFFNPNDLAKIDKNQFKNIYLITSLEEEPLFQALTKEKIAPYSIEYPIVFPSKNPLSNPSIETVSTLGTIYRLWP